jgi:hypothetical protein
MRLSANLDISIDITPFLDLSQMQLGAGKSRGKNGDITASSFPSANVLTFLNFQRTMGY